MVTLLPWEKLGLCTLVGLLENTTQTPYQLPTIGKNVVLFSPINGSTYSIWEPTYRCKSSNLYLPTCNFINVTRELPDSNLNTNITMYCQQPQQHFGLAEHDQGRVRLRTTSTGLANFRNRFCGHADPEPDDGDASGVILESIRPR